MKIFVALVHISFATIWLGGAFFYTVVLQPKLSALDTAQQRLLTRSLRATMTPLLAISAAATIVSGLVMMVQLHPLHPGSLSHSRWGLALIIGALASIGALVIAFVEARAARRDAWAIEAARARSLARLLPRERSARLVALALLFVALATMAVARYG
jgi:uncharacterized membrane protein